MREKGQTEAAKTLETPVFSRGIGILTEKKDIEITIRRIHHFIIIRVSNSCTTNPNIQDGCLQTSKPDSRHHGWGLKSVQTVVEKYQGTMEYTWTDSHFAISIMLFY